ncbi:MAG: NAD(P)H-hydrate epimerase [Candidatus Dormibacteraeota bacterium]|nr:NAD(P)H-hydrate epimerase [Candidatus Dormibacteraeota bacterium]
MSFSDLPTLTSRQVADIDALAQERFGISVDWLMEAAGWQVARFCRGRTAVVCGVGNNAGDGLAAARHLHRWGRLSSVSCVEAGRLRGAAARERDALTKVGVEVTDELRLHGAEVVLDALFGIGLSRPPEGKFAAWIEAINASIAAVVAVDVPSGLDADTGLAYAPTVRAHTTVTLGLAKGGLAKGDGPGVAGEVWLVDIGVPFEAYSAVGIDIPRSLFAERDQVLLETITK